MSTVEQIEDAILKLPPDDFRKLATWLSELDEQRWDLQIEKDVAAGKLDGMMEEALEQYRAGQFRTL